MLIVFGGLPGTGKTTVARSIAERCTAFYLRIDTIEQAIRRAGVAARDVGAMGYQVANALAAENLGVGRTVVADCVNPVAESRDAWRTIASRLTVRLVEVELICSDAVEHRRRVESRRSDIDGLVVPTWQAVIERLYEPWDGPHLVLDTAHLTPEQAAVAVQRCIDAGNEP